jgi:hypothetical protein
MSRSSPSSARIRATLPRLLAVPALAGAGMLAVACGGPSVPSSSSSPSNATSKAQASEQQLETKFLDFAKCLREHGVNAEVRAGGHGLKIGPGPGGPAAMEVGEKACARYRPPPQNANPSPQQKVENEEHVQKFAKCMRKHGIHVESMAGGGAIKIGIGGKPSAGSNPESPAFRQAQSACQKLLPGGAPGG